MNIFTAVKYCCILHGRVCVMFLQQKTVLIYNLLVDRYYKYLGVSDVILNNYIFVLFADVPKISVGSLS